MKDRKFAGDTWVTPKEFWDKINARFAFDEFDPCPWDFAGEAHSNGLFIPWAERTYCNPPYSQLDKEAFINKAFAESRRGKLAVLLLPVSTSTKIYHEVIAPNAHVEFLRGRLKFEGYVQKKNKQTGLIETWHINQGMGRTPLPVMEGMPIATNSGQHDSMLVIFDGSKK